MRQNGDRRRMVVEFIIDPDTPDKLTFTEALGAALEQMVLDPGESWRVIEETEPK